MWLLSLNHSLLRLRCQGSSRGHPCFSLTVAVIATSRRYVGKPSRENPCAAAGLLPKTLQLSDGATLNCGAVPTLDHFAQSRIANYVKRVSGAACTKTSKELTVARGNEKEARLVQVTMSIPVDAFYSGVLERSSIIAVGLATTERSALVAASMHAERCLDALGVALLSEGRQAKRAKELLACGRWAPSPHDSPSEYSEVQLPPYVLLTPPWLAISPTPDSTALPDPHQRNARLPGEQPFQAHHQQQRLQQHHSHQPHRRGRRSQNFTRRSGWCDPFASTASEMKQLFRVLMQHATQADEEEEDDVPIVIEAHEVEILQPDRMRAELEQHHQWSSASASARPSPGSIDFIGGQRSAQTRSYYIPRHFPCVDESEHGRFKLVDSSEDRWLPEIKNPIVSCIRDTSVHQRLKAYWAQEAVKVGADVESFTFMNGVKVTVTEEDTNMPQKHRWSTTPKQWFTASSIIPGEALGGEVEAIGKATSLQAAHDLCAMHAEELLNYHGIPLSMEVDQQLTEYDGCLRWGRCASPSPLPPQQQRRESDPLYPKPNKEWFVVGKSRLRVCPMSITEKLQALHRRVVSQFRQHHVEVDMRHHCQYDDVLAASPECLREFMQAQHHPFELAIMNFHLSPNEFRASVYLPLPPEYGVRGGCAVARTQEAAYTLCAMNALDVLFALDAVPVTMLKRPRWQSYLRLREDLQMILPASHSTEPGAQAEPVLPSLRSPPGYRDSPNSWCSRIPPAQDIWRVIMSNADDFDVCPDPTRVEALQGMEVFVLLRTLFTRYYRHAASPSHKTQPLPPQQMATGAKAPVLSLGSAPKCLNHYCGYQHQNQLRRVRANNCWMLLPIDPHLYGPRVAYGRCLTRNGAERSFYLHAFRTLRALDLAPWEALSRKQLLAELYLGDTVAMDRELAFWSALVTHVLAPDEPSTEATSTTTSSAQVVGDDTPHPAAVDHRKTPSPNPVMTPQLASLTLL